MFTTIGNIAFSDALIPPIKKKIKRETRRSIRWPENAPTRPTGYNACVVVPIDKEAGTWQITWPQHVILQTDPPRTDFTQADVGKPWPPSPIKCPYRVGGVYYLRETYYAYGYWRDVEGKLTPTGQQKREFVDLSATTAYYPYFYTDNMGDMPTTPDHPEGRQYYKRLARFMPRTAARLFVRVTDVLAQNLEDLTDADALAEGIEADEHGLYPIPGAPAQFRPIFPRLAFKRLWENLHGDYDPLHHVWVVKFELAD